MKSTTLVFAQISILILCFSCKNNLNESCDTNTFQVIDQQLEGMIHDIDNSLYNPRSTNDDGSLRLVKAKDWTSGFFPGILWMQYEYTRDPYWKDLAHTYSENIVVQQFNAGTHDMGFKMYCSYGNGYRLTHQKQYFDVLLQSANTLMKRYHSKVGCIRSWDFNQETWSYPVIIDNLMNLELLFWASRETRDSSYYNAAYSHAFRTLENHFRDDMSSYHVVDYSPETGSVIDKYTHQGLSKESAWARGQGWGLYGYTMVFRETKDSLFLHQADKIASYILTHKKMPTDGIPYWDFDDPEIPNTPRDASAAAVIASALYELALYSEHKNDYIKFADHIIKSLSSKKYLAAVGTNNHFILKHSTGNMPKNDEIDQPIIYADYYFMEALLRKIKLNGGVSHKKPFVILKLDDIQYKKDIGLTDAWKRTLNFAIDNQIKVNVGIIGNCLEVPDTTFRNTLVAYEASDDIEFWNHGYDHKKTDIGNGLVAEFMQNIEYQTNHFAKTQQLSKQLFGEPFSTFGAPYNHTNKYTQHVVSNSPEVNYWLYPPEKLKIVEGVKLLHRIPSLNIEYPVHQPSLYHLWNNLYFNENREVIVLQGHPNSWNNTRFSEFVRMINYMQNSDYEFITCRELESESQFKNLNVDL